MPTETILATLRERGFEAYMLGKRHNPFEDPIGIDYPGRKDRAAAFSDGMARAERILKRNNRSAA